MASASCVWGKFYCSVKALKLKLTLLSVKLKVNLNLNNGHFMHFNYVDDDEKWILRVESTAVETRREGEGRRKRRGDVREIKDENWERSLAFHINKHKTDANNSYSMNSMPKMTMRDAWAHFVALFWTLDWRQKKYSWIGCFDSNWFCNFMLNDCDDDDDDDGSSGDGMLIGFFSKGTPSVDNDARWCSTTTTMMMKLVSKIYINKINTNGVMCSSRSNHYLKQFLFLSFSIINHWWCLRMQYVWWRSMHGQKCPFKNLFVRPTKDLMCTFHHIMQNFTIK